MPASEMTAMSVVPPPMSTIMLPDGSVDRHAGADGGGHGFLDQVHFAGRRAVGAVFHRALFHLRDLTTARR